MLMAFFYTLLNDDAVNSSEKCVSSHFLYRERHSEWSFLDTILQVAGKITRTDTYPLKKNS